jgi:hypothetical protein
MSRYSTLRDSANKLRRMDYRRVRRALSARLAARFVKLDIRIENAFET